jgi:hypothetical protein
MTTPIATYTIPQPMGTLVIHQMGTHAPKGPSFGGEECIYSLAGIFVPNDFDSETVYFSETAETQMEADKKVIDLLRKAM